MGGKTLETQHGLPYLVGEAMRVCVLMEMIH